MEITKFGNSNEEYNGKIASLLLRTEQTEHLKNYLLTYFLRVSGSVIYMWQPDTDKKILELTKTQVKAIYLFPLYAEHFCATKWFFEYTFEEIKLPIEVNLSDIPKCDVKIDYSFYKTPEYKSRMHKKKVQKKISVKEAHLSGICSCKQDIDCAEVIENNYKFNHIQMMKELLCNCHDCVQMNKKTTNIEEYFKKINEKCGRTCTECLKYREYTDYKKFDSHVCDNCFQYFYLTSFEELKQYVKAEIIDRVVLVDDYDETNSVDMERASWLKELEFCETNWDLHEVYESSLSEFNNIY